MKKFTPLFFLFAFFLNIFPSGSFAQNGNLTSDKNILIHREVPGDAYLAPAATKMTSPGYRYKSSGFFTVQVNVDSEGNNILNDAANEPSIATDPTDPNKMAIGWRQFDNISSDFRQAGYGYTVNGGLTWTFPGVIDPGVFRSDPVLDYDTAGNFYYNSLTHVVINDTYPTKVFKSTNGGAEWDAGVDAKGGDKQWMTIDRSGGIGTGNIYSSWTSYFSTCQPGFFTRSIDGGASFQNCIEIPDSPYWGTQTVGPDGELYVVGSASYSGGLVVAKSTTAKNPASAVTWDFTAFVDIDGYISSGAPVNPGGLLGQANISVDCSNGPGHGNVYVLASVERISNNDHADVMFAKSTDGGLTWGLPKRINNDPG
ncbi:MAG: hypothetical protein WCI71_15755, partial [Bacteroidota bacterium]